MPESARQFKLRWFHYLFLLAAGAVIGLLIIIVINTHHSSTGQSKERQVQAEVAKLVILPTNETPALATVTDPTKLKYDPFLSQTQKGDEILIYAKWKQAVIYRPSADKVVDIGPVDVSQSGTGYTPLN